MSFLLETRRTENACWRWGRRLAQYTYILENLCLWAPFLTLSRLLSSHKNPLYDKNRTPKHNWTPFLVNHVRKKNGRFHVRMSTFILWPFVKKIVHSNRVLAWDTTHTQKTPALGALPNTSPDSLFPREPSLRRKQNTKQQKDLFSNESRPENGQFLVRMASFTRAIDFKTGICTNFCLNITHAPSYTSNYSPAMQRLSRVPLVANRNANVSSMWQLPITLAQY